MILRTIILAAFILTGLSACQTKSAEAETTIRVATYNVFLNRPEQGQLINDLSTSDNEQAKAVAEIIQRTAPDILLLNEIDHDPNGEALALFQKNYLEVGQNGAPPIRYEYSYTAPVNTGVHSGVDLDGDGVVSATPGDRAYGGDAFGFGLFEGQYGMAILSKYPIDEENVRAFGKFLWKDMPDAMLPDNAETSEPGDWYSKEALAVFRLSSKSHWDVPVIVDGERIHILASHPTPPAFDGEEDRNGRRNHDENRLWADYISPGKASYIYDDDGVKGGLDEGARFVILGDLNADPADGGSVATAIVQLLMHPAVAKFDPASEGGIEQSKRQGGVNLDHAGPSAFDTSDFPDAAGEGPGNLRLDYVLPSKAGFSVEGSGVFWPASNEPHHNLTGEGFPVVSSDHRLVWADLVIEPVKAK